MSELPKCLVIIVKTSSFYLGKEIVYDSALK